MADENKVTFTLSVEDLTKAGTDAAKKNLDQLGGTVDKTSQTAKLGFWGMGEAAENAAQSMGVPNQMSRQLGNSIENLAGRLGAGALAFGGLALVVMAGVGIWQHYAEAQRKASEETLKAADASGKWIESALGEAAQTRELIKAKNELKSAQFGVNKAALDAAIPVQIQKIKELEESYRTASAQANGTATIWIGSWQQAKEKAEKLNRELAVQKATLSEMQAQQKLFTEQNRQNISGGNRFPWEEYKAALDFEAQYQDALTRSLAINDATSIAQKNRAKDAEQWAKEEKEMFEGRLRSAEDMATGMAQAFQLMYQIGGHHARQYFTLYKAAAISETLISTYKAAQDSYAFGAKFGGPALGATMATIATLAGMARVASIRAQSFGGGAGAGGGAAGGAGNYSTVGADNNPYRYFNYEQSKYGTGWRPGEGGQGGATYVIQGDVYAQDDESFRKKVSTAVVRSAKNREYGVREAMA